MLRSIAAYVQRIAALEVATRYSQLVCMGNADLQDQLKHHKLVGKKAGFTVLQPNRSAYVLQLQALLSEVHSAAANDLPEGESGIEGRGIKRKASGGGGRKKGK